MKVISLLLLVLLPGCSQTRGVFVAATLNPAQLTTAVSTVTTSSTVNLSSYADWRLFSGPGSACYNVDGYGYDAKTSGRAISPLRQTGSGNYCTSIGNYVSNVGPTRFTTSDGSQTPQTALTSGLFGSVSGDTKYLMVPANNSVQTFQLWLTLLQARTVTVTFHLTDGSVTDSTLSTPVTLGGDSQAHLLYTVSFAAASNGQFLTVGFTNANSFYEFQAATLSVPAVTPNTYYVTAGLQPQDVVAFTKAADVIQLADTFSWTGTLVAPQDRPVTIRSALSLAVGSRVLRAEAKPKLLAPANGPAVFVPEGARNFSMDGIEVSFSIASGVNYGLINIQPNFRPSLTVSDLPHDISITHCYIHGTPITVPTTPTADISQHGGYFFNQINDGIYADGNRINISDSIISDIAFNGKEANGIKIQIGQYVTIKNNEVAANGENILMYAAGAYDLSTYTQVPSGGGLYPNHTEIAGNWIYKDPNWQYIRYTKNLVEQKNGRYTRIHDNVLERSFEGIYSQGQHGLGIAIASRTRGGAGTGDTSSATPWAATQHIEVDHNILYDMARAFQVQGPLDDFYCQDVTGTCTNAAIGTAAAAAGAERSTDWYIHDNYAPNLDGGKWGTVSSVSRWTSGTYQATGIFGQGGDYFHAEYNTFGFVNSPSGTVLPSGSYLGISYASHTVNATDNAGWNFVVDNRDVDSGGNAISSVDTQSKWQPTTGLVVNNNTFAWDLTASGQSGLIVLKGFTGYGWPPNTFQNNNIQSIFTSWSSDVSAANTAAPGQYTGNTVSVAPSSAQGVRNLSTLLAGEAAIRAGGR